MIRVTALLTLLPLAALPPGVGAAEIQVLGRRFAVHGEAPAVPPAIAAATGAQLSGTEVLGEVEERRWAARARSLALAERAARGRASDPRRDRSLEESRVAVRTYDDLARALRLSLGKQADPADGDFTAPDLPPDVAARYARLRFDPAQAHAAYRRVRAAYREGDPQLLAAAARFPLNLNRAGRQQVLRAPGEIAPLRDVILQARLRDVALRQPFATMFVRDAGAMFGDGELWIGAREDGFGLSAINLQERPPAPGPGSRGRAP